MKFGGKKIGRNDPCPCGSGKKYKKCHLLTGIDDIENRQKGLIVEDYTYSKKVTYNVGSPGVMISEIVHFGGDYEIVQQNPSDFIFVLNVDVPAYLPLQDNFQYKFKHNSDLYFLYHKTKERGEEFYSTLDTSNLPYFSSIQVQGQVTRQISTQIECKKTSYDLIVYVLNKINSFLDNEYKIGIGDKPILSYHILFYPKNNFPNSKPVAKATIPYTGVIDIKGPENKILINNELLKSYLTEKIKIEKFTEDSIIPDISDKSFSETIFITAHDFSFYCAQHPSSLNLLYEEQIRDLYLIILKTIFSGAEGEVFNYDGKSDFKVTNPNNKYQFVIGEFKWWKDEASFKEVFNQAVRKHSTGLEQEIYILMLNKNKYIFKVYEKIKNLIELEPEFFKIVEEKLIPEGSKQLFNKYEINVKGYKVQLILGLINLWHQKV
jgi:hypothetical protein